MDSMSSQVQFERRYFPEKDVRLAHDILGTDPLFHRIPGEAADELVNMALSTGEVRAERILRRYGIADPIRLARKLDVRIIFDITAPSKRMAFNALSCYCPSPPSITVFENTLQVFRENPGSALDDLKNFVSKLTSICVAHELYHHLEYSKFDFINLSYKITVVDMKLFKIEKSLCMLAEIAANSFAKRLMHLPRLPAIMHEGFLDTEGNGGVVQA